MRSRRCTTARSSSRRFEPYLDGYYAVVEAYQYANTGCCPPARFGPARRSSPRTTPKGPRHQQEVPGRSRRFLTQGNRLGRALRREARPSVFEDAETSFDFSRSVMASVVDSTAERVGDTSKRNRWSLGGITRRPEFGAVVATALVYLFFAITTHGAGF